MVLAVNEEQRGIFSTQRGMEPTLQTSPRLHENFWLLAGHSLAFFSAPAASSFRGCRSSSARCQALKSRIWGRNSVRSPQTSGRQPLRAWETRPPGSRRRTQNAPALCEPPPEAGCPVLDHVTLQALGRPYLLSRRPRGSCLFFGGIYGICVLPRGFSLPAPQSSCLFREPGGVRASHSSYLSD